MMSRSFLIGLGCWLIASTGILGGCGDEVNLDNTGLACLTTSGEWPEGGQVFEADQSVTVVVRFDDCLSSSCDTNRQGSCDVEVSADRIVISSQGSYTDESGAGSSCTDDCGVFDVTCDTGPIPEGEYTLVYGSEEIDLSIPGPTGNYCVPNRT